MARESSKTVMKAVPADIGFRNGVTDLYPVGKSDQGRIVLLSAQAKIAVQSKGLFGHLAGFALGEGYGQLTAIRVQPSP